MGKHGGKKGNMDVIYTTPRQAMMALICFSAKTRPRTQSGEVILAVFWQVGIQQAYVVQDWAGLDKCLCEALLLGPPVGTYE